MKDKTQEEEMEAMHGGAGVGEDVELPCTLQSPESSTSMGSPTEELTNLCKFGVFTEASSCKHDQSLTTSSSTIILWRERLG